MADKFNENLSMFLTSCRESARKELNENNSDYKKLLSDMAKFSERIQHMIPDEYEAMADNFHALMRMEVNHLYLQGFRDCINLYKRFDGSFVESRDFGKHFI